MHTSPLALAQAAPPSGARPTSAPSPGPIGQKTTRRNGLQGAERLSSASRVATPRRACGAGLKLSGGGQAEGPSGGQAGSARGAGAGLPGAEAVDHAALVQPLALAGGGAPLRGCRAGAGALAGHAQPHRGAGLGGAAARIGGLAEPPCYVNVTLRILQAGFGIVAACRSSDTVLEQAMCAAPPAGFALAGGCATLGGDHAGSAPVVAPPVCGTRLACGGRRGAVLHHSGHIGHRSAAVAHSVIFARARVLARIGLGAGLRGSAAHLEAAAVDALAHGFAGPGDGAALGGCVAAARARLAESELRAGRAAFVGLGTRSQSDAENSSQKNQGLQIHLQAVGEQ